MRFVGQWAPIVGTGLAVLGSLSFRLATKLEGAKGKADPIASVHHCTCAIQEVGRGRSEASSRSGATPDATATPHHFSKSDRGTSSEKVPTTNEQAPGHDLQANGPRTADVGNRRKVANALLTIGNYLGTAAHDRFDDSEFKHGKAVDFPEIPGEEQRNSALTQIRDRYNQHRETDGDASSMFHERPSRAGSFAGSISSGFGVDGGTRTPRSSSPQPPSSPLPSPTTPRRQQHASTLPAGKTSFELQNAPSSSSAASGGGGLAQRRATLAVPSRVPHGSSRNNPPASSIAPTVTVAGGQNSPAIVISSEPDPSSPAQTPLFNLHAPPPSSEPLPTPAPAALPPSPKHRHQSAP